MKELEDNWETLRDEALELIRLTPDHNVSYGIDAVANVKYDLQNYFRLLTAKSFDQIL